MKTTAPMPAAIIAKIRIGTRYGVKAMISFDFAFRAAGLVMVATGPLCSDSTLVPCADAGITGGQGYAGIRSAAGGGVAAPGWDRGASRGRSARESPSGRRPSVRRPSGPLQGAAGRMSGGQVVGVVAGDLEVEMMP